MKTSIEINKKKIDLIKKISSDSTLRELVDNALDAYLAELRRKKLAEMLGTDFFEGNLKKMRGKSGNSRR